jgi:hypothetical protein
MTEEQVSHFVNGCTYIKLADKHQLMYDRLPLLRTLQ